MLVRYMLVCFNFWLSFRRFVDNVVFGASIRLANISDCKLQLNIRQKIPRILTDSLPRVLTSDSTTKGLFTAHEVELN